MGPEDRILALSSFGFDLSVYDYFGLLAAGGTVVIPEVHGARQPAHWASLLEQHQLTLWNSVPASMEMLVEHIGGKAERSAHSLRLVLLSGDWIPLALPDRVRGLNPSAEVVSLGGATEASIWSVIYHIDSIDPSWKSIPYGKAMLQQAPGNAAGRPRPRSGLVPLDGFSA